MSETSGTNKINNSNKSEQLFNKKNSNNNNNNNNEKINQQQQQQQQQAPQTLPRVYMIKVLDKKQEQNQDYNTILIGGNNTNRELNYNNNNNTTNTKKMKNKLNNSLVIEDMEENQQASSQMNTARNGALLPPPPKQLAAQQIQNKSKKLGAHADLNGSLNSSLLSNGVDSSLLSLTNNSNASFSIPNATAGVYAKENSVVQVNEKLLNRGIQTENHGNGAHEDLINKSGSNIYLLSMSHSSSLNSSRVTSSADLSSKQNSKLM